MMTIPPVHFINVTTGAGHSSGSMIEFNFIVFMKQFVSHACFSPDDKALLLLDNHKSHVSIEALNFEK